MARCVNFGGESFSKFVDSDEFVTEDASIIHVAACQLDVGVADACEADSKKGFAGDLAWFRKVAAELDRGAVAGDSSHDVRNLQKF